MTNGMDEWWYSLGSSVNQVKNFSLTMNTDFDQIDFPETASRRPRKIIPPRDGNFSGLCEPVEQRQNRYGDAAKAQPRTLGQPGKSCCANFALFCFFPAIRHNYGAANQNSPDELFLYRHVIFQFSFAFGISGGPCFRACFFHHRVGGFRGFGGFLHAARGRAEIRLP